MSAVKIGKHGNSLSLRLPAFVAQSMKLKAGDYVRLRYLDDGSLRVVPVRESKMIPAEGAGVAPAAERESDWDEGQW